MRTLFSLLLLSVMSVSIMAQATDKKAEADKSVMDNVVIRKIGELELNFKENNSLIAMRKGVDITLKGKTDKDDLYVKANTILFTYATKEDKKPSGMELSGNIRIKMSSKNGDLLIKSEKASINTQTEVAHFPGKTHVTLPDMGDLVMNNIRVDLKNGHILASNIEGTGDDSPAKEETQ